MAPVETLGLFYALVGRIGGMDQKSPIWTLRKPCPCCEQGHTLELLVCPKCLALVAACNEAGCLFSDPMGLRDPVSWPCDVWVSTYTKCPHCGTETELRHATAAEIKTHNIVLGDYC